MRRSRRAQKPAAEKKPEIGPPRGSKVRFGRMML